MKKINPINPGRASVVAFGLVAAVAVRSAMGAGSSTGHPNNQLVIKNVQATAYYCPYNSEMEGTQTLTVTTVSGKIYSLKASFLFGGHGAPMQGTGRSDPNGVYIRYDGSGGEFVGMKNEKEFTDKIKKRYADMGVTDFTGFGRLALSKPDKAIFSVGGLVIGASGRVLAPMRSIAVDPSVIPLDSKGKIAFKNGEEMGFCADDKGGGVKGNHIDIYLGEGKKALEKWYKSGGNRFVTVSF